jgi:hypothetical protein
MATQHSGAFTDLGKVEDLYYTDPDNCKVEAIPVEYNTRFTNDFTSKSSGTSTFIIPPGNGLKHIVISLGYNAASLAAQIGNNALPQGWGYSAIQQISFRIGGSSQYFMSGQQLLAKVLRQVRTQTQAQALLQLGGSAVGLNVTYGTAGTGDFAVNQYAYVVVPVWCMPGADGLNVPLPADTLAQQVQITCTLNPPSAFWLNNGTAAPAPPAQFDVATFQVEQLCMVDRGMAIANHVDLNTHELLMPVVFDQQELQVQIPANSNVLTSPYGATLTGFRSGQVKSIQVWLTKNNDAANPLLWYAPAAVTVLYAGTIYANYSVAGSSVMFNTLDGTKPPAVSYTKLVANAGAAFTSVGGISSQYCLLPFANPTGDDYSAEVLTHGKPILNGLVNLQIVAPTADAYTLHVAYIYNSTLVFSKSSAEFRF